MGLDENTDTVSRRPDIKVIVNILLVFLRKGFLALI